MESCNDTGSCSHNYGFTVDVLHELAEMYNFTCTLTKFSSDDWGTSPITGKWGDPNATFGGVFGKVFYIFKTILNNSYTSKVSILIHANPVFWVARFLG